MEDRKNILNETELLEKASQLIEYFGAVGKVSEKELIETAIQLLVKHND